ncbi:MAG: enoyl-CoA hydratase/isomerase family protein [Pseudomonadaceae bacterium]|nr:enoyl-CoA hydratase/isomerase family protein [Pseudomonadaceae bacterium]
MAKANVARKKTVVPKRKSTAKATPQPSAGIRKVAVIGAGVMGAGIAAQIANAGLPVRLLDILPKDAPPKKKGNEVARNAIALGAIAKLKKSNPAALMHPRNAKLIEAGNTTDNMADLADCDWIIEAVIEHLDIKQALYKAVHKAAPKAIVSSNTSTIPLTTLVEGMPKAFRERFLITHFFNPPRYMRLLELVTGADTASATLKAVEDLADTRLGKSLVPCADTPGFIANRIGTYWLHAAVVKAISHNVDVESADAVLGKPFGIPRTGVFGLIDLVGLDLIPHVLSSMFASLPKNDPFHALGPAPKLMETMIAAGNTGRKGKGGFYRLDEHKNKQVINLHSAEYANATRPKPAALAAGKKGGARALLEHNSVEATYAWEVMGRTLAYAAGLVGEIAEDIEKIDRAMRLGYNWKFGPFELIDKLGTAWFAARLEADGQPIPRILQVAQGRKLYRNAHGQLEFLGLDGKYHAVTRPAGVLLLEDIKRRSQPVAKNISASLWDVGDGVLCLEFHSKMNSLNPFIFNMVHKAIRLVGKGKTYKALVIYNEGSNFSVGANIGMLLVACKLHAWPFIRWILRRGQSTYQALKYAPFPVVGAPAGMALGGGCEILLHCHKIVAHAETYVGLVEGGVGIIPGWGGCKELLGRATAHKKTPKGPMPPLAKTFETIGTAKVAKSAAEAKDLLFFRDEDEIVMNRDRVLADAKAAALAMVPNFAPPQPFVYTPAGAGGLTALKLALHDFAAKGLATPHDVVVGTWLARCLTGGPDGDLTRLLNEDDLLRLERESFVPLTQTKATLARVEHMLKKGKPLRN